MRVDVQRPAARGAGWRVAVGLALRLGVRRSATGSTSRSRTTNTSTCCWPATSPRAAGSCISTPDGTPAARRALRPRAGVPGVPGRRRSRVARRAGRAGDGPCRRRFAPIRIVQAVLGGVLVWLVGLLLGAAARRPAAAAAPRPRGWLAAVYPPLVWTPAYVLSETLFTVLPSPRRCRSTLRSAARRRRSAGLRRRGAAAGLARPHAAGDAVLPAARRALAVPAPREWRWPSCCSSLGVRAASSCRGRSATRAGYGRFVLVASEGGITFWTGNHPLGRRRGRPGGQPATEAGERRRSARGTRASRPRQLEPLYYREALALHPRAPARLAAR